MQDEEEKVMQGAAYFRSQLYLGLKANTSGILPLGLAFHTGKGSNRVKGLQIGLVFWSFWLASREVVV